jgi:hypothetical protein
VRREPKQVVAVARVPPVPEQALAAQVRPEARAAVVLVRVVAKRLVVRLRAAAWRVVARAARRARMGPRPAQELVVLAATSPVRAALLASRLRRLNNRAAERQRKGPQDLHGLARLLNREPKARQLVAMAQGPVLPPGVRTCRCLMSLDSRGLTLVRRFVDLLASWVLT